MGAHVSPGETMRHTLGWRDFDFRKPPKRDYSVEPPRRWTVTYETPNGWRLFEPMKHWDTMMLLVKLHKEGIKAERTPLTLTKGDAP